MLQAPRSCDDLAAQPVGDDPPAPFGIFTVDVEEYFHASNLEASLGRTHWPTTESRLRIGLERLIGLLAEASAGATCFVLGWVAERHPRLVRELADRGLEIASHGYDHRRVGELTPEAFAEDLRRAEEAIGAATGARVRGYRAPNFSITRDTLWAIDVLIDRGYRFDSSIFPAYHPEYGIPGGPARPFLLERSKGRAIREFPLAVWSPRWLPAVPAAGGGYLRQFPYPLSRALLRRISRDRNPFTFYCHPWELDPDQPRVKTGAVRGLRHYRGLAGFGHKLRRLLHDFPFVSVSEAAGSIRLPLERLE